MEKSGTTDLGSDSICPCIAAYFADYTLSCKVSAGADARQPAYLFYEMVCFLVELFYFPFLVQIFT